ncbi:dienelactone hydrolase family protein [Bacillus tequilensis]|uniref:dienelactone hydrolase family protein n=1 Tax=Bacillus tequilensis TaxID=227866 RepID=UPI0004664D75|nr:dienelactone hydrolase family protein [Bacillus tequilensis]MDR4433781.1 dienelactone hydrolase family protein [Bacillus tequilensis]
MPQKPLVILAHEIYGVNTHMKKMARLIKMAGYDVLTPNLLEDGEVYTLQEEKTAYEQFTKHKRLKTGEFLIQHLIRQNAGRPIFVIGFSAGATIAWKCSSMPEVSGAVCYYGSRIRDSLYHVPACSVFMFFPSYEPSFDVALLIKKLREKQHPHVEIYQFEALHGFANPDSDTFDRVLLFKTLSIIKNEAEKWPHPVSSTFS